MGKYIRAPYCEHKYLSEIAHSHGINVSPEEIAKDPDLEKKICNFAKNDQLIEDICGRHQLERDKNNK